MMLSRRAKITSMLLLLVLVSIGVGFFFGAIVSKEVTRRKNDPVFWRKKALRQMEKLEPTPEQRQKFEERTDAAVKELVEIRAETVARAHEVVARAVTDIEKELTPEQIEVFQRFKPKDKGPKKATPSAEE